MMRLALALLVALAAAAPAWAQVPPDSLAPRLLTAAMEETERSAALYHEVPGLVESDSADSAGRARQKAFAAALAAERAETLLRIRFALLGGPPTETEDELRVLASLLSVTADDLIEAETIDAAYLRRALPEITDRALELVALVREAEAHAAVTPGPPSRDPLPER